MNSEKYKNFNFDKLPGYCRDFSEKKVAIVGCGAVGGDAAVLLVKMGVIQLTLIDFDPFETENIIKTASIYRIPEDSGKNKALALAERLNELIGEECVHGIDSNVTYFGPMSFADYDVIILALDNYAAKIYCNQIWLQIPKDRRPLLLFGGTIGESAQSNSLDGTECCVRCLFDEKWLINPFERTSCTGINYRNPEMPAEFARTTALASMEAAIQIVEKCRAYFLGHKEVVNKRTVYTAYPNLNLYSAVPMRRKKCPDCKNFHSVEDVIALDNIDVIHSTMGDLLKAISSHLKKDSFEILVSRIEFGKVGYNKIIVDDYCKCCGKPMKKLYRHEFRTSYEDLLCEDCKQAGNSAKEEMREEKIGSYISAIEKECTDECLKNRSLFDLGYRLGDIIWVKQKLGGLDCFDSEIKYTPFYCENDQTEMGKISKVEE